jgi:hypothetical protein
MEDKKMTKRKTPAKAPTQTAVAGPARRTPPSAEAKKHQRNTGSKLRSKADLILGLLRRKNGASVAEIAQATGWQAHSVRGFLSGTVKKKLKLKIADDKPEGGARRYFVKSAS